MYHEFKLKMVYKQDYPHIIAQWQWFRDILIQIYGLDFLPETFSETDGHISQRSRATEEDDPYEYYTRAAEYNYSWHCQTLTFAQNHHKVLITINNDEFYCYYWFSYENITIPESKVKLFLAFNKSILELYDSCEKFEFWQQKVVNILDMES